MSYGADAFYCNEAQRTSPVIHILVRCFNFLEDNVSLTLTCRFSVNSRRLHDKLGIFLLHRSRSRRPDVHMELLHSLLLGSYRLCSIVGVHLGLHGYSSLSGTDTLLSFSESIY